MSIIKIIKHSKKPVFSFEIFPPKNLKATLSLGVTLEKLKNLNPAYISITYGSGGSTRDLSFDLCHYIQNTLSVTTMSHYTCVGHTKEEIKKDLTKLLEIGIENYVLLRGDPPKGEEKFQKKNGGFFYAYELIQLMREINKNVSIAVAGYPEKHIEAPSFTEDLQNLKKKINSGGNFIITQIFFDNQHYFNFVKEAKKIGINKPIIPGIMPISNAKQIKKFTQLCGATLPKNLLKQIEVHQNDSKKIKTIGTHYAIKQCQELLKSNVPGIHFYCLNRFDQIQDILKSF